MSRLIPSSAHARRCHTRVVAKRRRWVRSQREVTVAQAPRAATSLRATGVPTGTTRNARLVWVLPSLATARRRLVVRVGGFEPTRLRPSPRGPSERKNVATRRGAPASHRPRARRRRSRPARARRPEAPSRGRDSRAASSRSLVDARAQAYSRYVSRDRPATDGGAETRVSSNSGPREETKIAATSSPTAPPVASSIRPAASHPLTFG